jgi:molybdate transport system permease protein
VTRTLPLEIYLQRETDADAAVALSLVLVAVAVTVVGLTYRRPGRPDQRSAEAGGAAGGRLDGAR